MARKLDSETIARFRQNGHVVVAGLAHEAELEELRTIYDRILADLHGESRDCYEQATVSPQFTWVRKPETVHARLLQLDLFHQARGFAAQLLDLRESALTGSYRIFHKPALIGGATPWHQDAVYKDTAVSHCVHVWIPLDPAHAENGHIRYISGSHRDGLLRFVIRSKSLSKGRHWHLASALGPSWWGSGLVDSASGFVLRSGRVAASVGRSASARNPI